MSIDDERRSMYDMYGQLERRVDTNDARGEGDIRLLAQRMQQLDKEREDALKLIEKTNSRIDELLRDKESFFKWGVIALGSVVVGIGSWLGSILMGGHIK